ncbi:hypothetical protein [Pedobacter punctiformis]|uniref:Uncharacterized protein n=1 Tax=Pedobacter punctiformis TaxID=3004097 RepID=A0ABT4L9H6_9SPHI|nr:hypothetical protein [Pedobacter sp. HCMS5-2]MCZ4244565.1 hypothetical protein [Pedobacter sp. HCMS5-2]
MKKIYALLKPYALVLTLLTATTIIIYSCKKDRETSSAETKNELISEAKSYFEDEVLKKSLKDSNDPNFRHSIIKRPIWEKAITKKISLGEAVIVPVKFDGGVFTKPEKTDMVNYLDKTSYLMLYRDKKQKMHAEWVTLIPDKIRKAKSEQFSGIVAIEDWGGKFNRAYAFNGTGKYFPVYIRQAVTFSESNYKRSTFCIEVQHWGYISWANGPAIPKYLGSETFCFTSDSPGGTPDSYGTLSDGTRMDEEPNPDAYPSYYIDCNGDIDGSAVIDDNCGCIGGNTGFQSCAQKEIRDSVKNACIKNALTLALSRNAVNEIKTLFYDAFGSNKNYNVVFADGSLSSTTKDATTKTLLDPITGIITSTITFNTDVAGIRSEQYAVSTIYHEMVHAELRKLFPEDSQGKILIPSQHEYMAQNFVDKIMASLKSVFPNLSDTDAWALSWGGLKQTSFFDLLSDANKTMIGETLMKYSDKDRYDKLGSYCN